MDLDKAIRELYEEKRLLDQVIASLELLVDTEHREEASTSYAPGRRGRKAMSPQEREIVSQRMKEYWARRKDADGPDRSGNGK